MSEPTSNPTSEGGLAAGASGHAAAAAEASPQRSFRGLGKVIFFFALVTVLAFAIDAAISFSLRRVTTSKFGAFNQVVAGRVNADVVISGSSRALVHYDPRVIQEVTGRTAFNLGMNGVPIDVQLGVLKTYLRRNKKPAMVIQNLEAFTFEATRKGEIYDPAMYVPYLSEPDLYQALVAIDPVVWKWRHIPLYGYAVEDMNFTWARAALATLGAQPQEDYFLGFNPRYLNWTEDFESFQRSVKDGVSYRIEPGGIAALEEVMRLCKEQGIRCVISYSPEYAGIQAMQKNRAEIFAKFRELAAKHGAEFWDFSDSPLCQSTANFYNSQHLNAAGAAKFSLAVAQRVKSELK